LARVFLFWFWFFFLVFLRNIGWDPLLVLIKPQVLVRIIIFLKGGLTACQTADFDFITSSLHSLLLAGLCLGFFDHGPSCLLFQDLTLSLSHEPLRVPF
jgi:hypothetical protein